MAEQRRRWFQLSLTTWIVMMVVAAVLVWLNVRSRPAFSQETKAQIIKTRPAPLGKLLKNLLTALAILAVAGCGCEWWLRRRGKSTSLGLESTKPS